MIIPASCHWAGRYHGKVWVDNEMDDVELEQDCRRCAEKLGFRVAPSQPTGYVEIDASGLGAIQGRMGVYVIPNEVPLNLTGRLLSSGKVPVK